VVIARLTLLGDHEAAEMEISLRVVRMGYPGSSPGQPTRQVYAEVSWTLRMGDPVVGMSRPGSSPGQPIRTRRDSMQPGMRATPRHPPGLAWGTLCAGLSSG
jgi:hypothetical protein